MQQYKDLIIRCLFKGEQRDDRTGVGTTSIFGASLDIDVRGGFPLVTLKKTLWRSAFIEMLWFLRGESNIDYLKEHNVKIWDAWADKAGNLGPVYGVQWRHWPGKLHALTDDELLNNSFEATDFVGFAPHRAESGKAVYLYQKHHDQLKELIDGIKQNPSGRRHIVTAWNPGFIADMGLPPCHRDFQCYVTNDGHLDLMMSQRSADLLLGVPFNIAQYSLLLHLLARATNLKARRLRINYGDVHIYKNHMEAATELVKREPLSCKSELVINTDNTDIDGYTINDFNIEGYESYPFINLTVAV
jgi:thymidylate synthase